jgi:hypothetical protein
LIFQIGIAVTQRQDLPKEGLGIEIELTRYSKGLSEMIVNIA